MLNVKRNNFKYVPGDEKHDKGYRNACQNHQEPDISREWGQKREQINGLIWSLDEKNTNS